MKRVFTKLMSQAGVQVSRTVGGQGHLPIIAQGEGHHASSENRVEHWSVVCRSCDRRGAAVCGVSPASAEEGTGNQVFFKGGFVAMNSNK